MSQVNNGVLRILPYQNATVMDGSRIHETGHVIHEHRDVRLDVDNMTYEELVALEEQIGDVSTGLTESYIQENLRSTFYLPGAAGVSDQFLELSLENDACIICQYAEKDFVRKHNVDEIQLAQQMWDNVSSNNKKGVYSLIVGSNADVNFSYGHTSFNSALTLGKALLLQEQPGSPSNGSSRCFDRNPLEKDSPGDSISPASTSARIDELDDYVEGLSLLHLACRVADLGMVELLLQYGAHVNSTDSRGRTPLHHCIMKGRHVYAKLLLSRGADSQATDRDGRTALQYAIDSGTIDDEEILVLLEDPSR